MAIPAPKKVGSGPDTTASKVGGTSPAKSSNASMGTRPSAGGMSSDSPYKGTGKKKGSGKALAAAVSKASGATSKGANKASRAGRMGS